MTISSLADINAPLVNLYTISAIGDSQTDFLTPCGVSPDQTWTAQLAKRITRIGGYVRTRGFGVAGNTTSQMLARADVLFNYDAPTIGIIYGGVNDPFSAVTTQTAQAGASNTITLTSGSSSTSGSYVGQVITTTGDTGSGQSKTIISYDGSTKIATVDSAWSVNPNNTTTYTIAALTQAQTQANLQALVKVLKFRAIGQGAGLGCTVWSQTSLPANGEPGQRYVVMRDTSTTGGVQRSSTAQNANITGDYSASPQQTIWEWRNPQAGESGWARVATSATAAFSDGCAKVLVFTQSYLNWASGGDNYNTAAGTGSQYASYVPVRAAATAAASAESVTLCDVYDFQSKLIYGGTFNGLTLASETTQGSESYHYTAGNQHYNAYGHDTVARAAAQTVVNAGWLTVLS